MSTHVDVFAPSAILILMNIITLKTYLKIKNMNASKLAHAAGLTRQAVSKWFVHAEKNNQDFIQADWASVIKISHALEISSDKLTLNPFAKISSIEKKQFETLLLWDKLYENLESFIVDLVKKNKRAIARYVQVFGILNAEKIWGKWVYKEFPRYARYLHLARKKELELLCQNLKSLNLI